MILGNENPKEIPRSLGVLELSPLQITNLRGGHIKLFRMLQNSHVNQVKRNRDFGVLPHTPL